MAPLAYTIRLTGEAVELEHGQFWAETRAVIPAEPVAPHADGLRAGCGLCRRAIHVRPDGSLVETGEISFGGADAITFRARGTIGASPEPELRHGTAVLEVTGGRGRLAGARGYVVSNFLLTDAGQLTDHHLALLFIDPARRSAGERGIHHG